MNHLRELLECPISGMLFQDGIGDSEAAKLFNALQAAGPRAVCFELGDYDDFVAMEFATVPELCRLPYDTCWFEVNVPLLGDRRWLFACLVGRRADGKLAAIGLSRGPVGWAVRWHARVDFLSSTLVDCVPGNAIAEITQSMALIARFLSALHCSNVHRQEHAPDTKLQKARAKRGKAPLFSYWTLQLNGKNERGDNQGGTHATPRVHLRRGHPRQYAPGKWTWVQAHAVGNRAAGMVHKDYSAGRMLTSLATRSAA